MEPQVQLSSIDVIASALAPVIPDVGRMSSPDGAVTLMMSDIADAPTAAAALGPEQWERLLRDHRALVEQLLAHHDGSIIKFEQDGFCASFNSAHAGLHAAVELQRTFTGSTAAEHKSLAVRVGLHSGFVLGDAEQLLGRNVVLAARIAGQAKPGEILVSSTLKDYTRSDPSFRFEPRGEYHFKGLLGEHTVYGVAWN